MRGRHSNPTTNNLLIPCFFFPDCFLLAGVVVLWYFMEWWTQTFTLHIAAIPCSDLDHYSYENRPELIPDIIVYVIAFVLPPIVMLFGEAALALYNLQGGKRQLIREKTVMTFGIKLHALLRRTVRFTGIFLLGAFLTWILTRAGQLIVGRPSPSFFDVSSCSKTPCSGSFDVGTCFEDTDADKYEAVRQSFPSLYSSLSTYASLFVAVYIMAMMRLNAALTLRPFITLCCLAIPFLLGLEQIAYYKAHWTDVIAGWILGGAVAAYLIFGILDTFYGPLPPASERMDTEYESQDDYVLDNPGADKPMQMNGLRGSQRDGAMQETYVGRPIEVNGVGGYNRENMAVEPWRGGREANAISGKRVPDGQGRGVDHYMYY